MYQQHFGLSAEPFSIAPDPHFLYHSERHQEALAHLVQGLQGSGGFILLTGEVGTGKTTVSRALLEQLPDSTEIAFILNPMLNEDELLATLCDEWGIRYQKGRATRKVLTDKISQFLLDAHQQDRQCVVLIDEAQHLKPQVLEQLRLLTNLETTKSKLLRVILIGQPELQTLLKRQELRQLAQRITARYHLLPLTNYDTERYIAYRCQMAGANRPLFTQPAAMNAHKLTGGVPRLLNLLCDRALLVAYADGQMQVDKAHVKRAAHELGQFDEPHQKANQRPRWPWLLLPLAAMAIAAVIRWWPATEAEVSASERTYDYHNAQLLASAWQLPKPPRDKAFCDWVTNYQLACLRTHSVSVAQLQSINYPALLLSDGQAGTVLASMEPVDTHAWSGEVIGLYQRPDIRYQRGSADVDELTEWVKQQLARYLSDSQQRLDARTQLQALQRKAGLPVTGELNPLTLAWLSARYYESGPRLQEVN